MFNDYRPYFAEINLDNFRHNFRETKRIAPGKKTLGVIKADGYGHGAVELAGILVDEGVDYLVVAVIAEAVELRRAGFEKPILVLGYTVPAYIKEIVEYNITQAVFDYETAEKISNEAQRQRKIAKIHIKLDTGMGRIGYLSDIVAVNEIIKIEKLKNLYVEGIFSHFATADEKNKKFTYSQIQKYVKMIDELERVGINIEIKHIANSAAIIDFPDTYFDGVRPGIMLYGYYPSEEVNKENVLLKQVMSLKANIIHIKSVPEGTPISYGCRFITNRSSFIATLPFGYADGFTRLYFEKAKVIAGDKLVPVIGSICMDQCMIDITECDNLIVGDEIIVMGMKNGLSIDAEYHAQLLGTISYEILCMVSRRVPRVYIENNKIIKVKNYV